VRVYVFECMHVRMYMHVCMHELELNACMHTYAYMVCIWVCMHVHLTFVVCLHASVYAHCRKHRCRVCMLIMFCCCVAAIVAVAVMLTVEIGRIRISRLQAMVMLSNWVKVICLSVCARACIYTHS